MSIYLYFQTGEHETSRLILRRSPMQRPRVDYYLIIFTRMILNDPWFYGGRHEGMLRIRVGKPIL
jgi:hypothetical protein